MAAGAGCNDCRARFRVGQRARACCSRLRRLASLRGAPDAAPPRAVPSRECAPEVHAAAAAALLAAARQPVAAAELADCAPFWVLRRLLARGDGELALPPQLAALGRQLVQAVEAALLGESGGCSRAAGDGATRRWLPRAQVEPWGGLQHGQRVLHRRLLRLTLPIPTSPAPWPPPPHPPPRMVRQESGPPCWPARQRWLQMQRPRRLSGAPPLLPTPPPLTACRRYWTLLVIRCCRRLPPGLATTVSGVPVCAPQRAWGCGRAAVHGRARHVLAAERARAKRSRGHLCACCWPLPSSHSNVRACASCPAHPALCPFLPGPRLCSRL